MQAGLVDSGLKVLTFNGLLLHEPWRVQLDMSGWRGHFGTLTPFHHACKQSGAAEASLLQPGGAKMPCAPSGATVQACRGVPLDALGLVRLPVRGDGTLVDWAEGIRGAWEFGEEAALRIFRGFCATGLPKYESKRQLVGTCNCVRAWLLVWYLWYI